MRRKFWVGLCAMGLGMGIAGNYASAAPDAPKTTDTKPAAPKPVDVPPGYEKVSDKGFNILCEPNDKAWVTKALEQYKAQDRIKGGPADMLKAFATNRPVLVKQMVADLSAADDKAINQFLDEKIVATLQKLDTLKVPVYYLVTTPEKLARLTENGWGEPKFHYNRVAKAAAFDDNLNISIDQPMDDQIRVAFYNDSKDSKETNEDRSKGLASYLAQQDAGIYAALAQQAPGATLGLFTTWLDEKQVAPLGFKRDQDWFRWGVVNYLAAKYAAIVTDLPRDNYLNALLTENNMTPVRAHTIDLLKPIDKAKLRDILQPHYEAALQRKGLAVVKYWVEKAGEAELPKTLAAIKAKKPADGDALVKLIDETTKVDLSKAMAAQ